MENEKIFSTRDLYLASTLMTLGFKTVGIDFQLEGNRDMPVGYFNFEETEILREAESEYWQGEIAIDPRQFITNMKGLKSQVNSVYKSPRADYSKFKKKK